MGSGYMIDGFLTSSENLTYNRAGIRIHTTEMGSRMGDMHRNILHAEFVDFDSGVTTDRFYGVANDFNVWFAAKAAKGDKFYVLYHDYSNAPKRKVPYDEQGKFIEYVKTKYGTMQQLDDGGWAKMPCEPLRRIGSSYYLMNGQYAYTLSDDERSAEIARSLALEGQNAVWQALGV